MEARERVRQPTKGSEPTNVFYIFRSGRPVSRGLNGQDASRSRIETLLTEAKELESRAKILFQQGRGHCSIAANLFCKSAQKYRMAGNPTKAEEMEDLARDARGNFESLFGDASQIM